MKSLSNKVVVITGAGSGIGRALALNVAAKGARVAISDWNEEGLAETVDLLKNAGAAEIKADQLDVSDKDAFVAYAAGVKEHRWSSGRSASGPRRRCLARCTG